MRVKSINIRSWRQFRGVLIEIPPTSSTVCLIGGNGTGKSQILELIAAASAKIGLSSERDFTRGSPFHEDASFEIVFSIETSTLANLNDLELVPNHLRLDFQKWDRTLLVSYLGSNAFDIKAGGIEGNISIEIAQYVVACIGNSQSIHYLFLDADRAYPPISINARDYGDALERNWGGSAKASSAKLVRNLYEEWFKYLLAMESNNNNKHAQDIRKARSAKEKDPVFEDPFLQYRDAVSKVLSHLLFVGVDSSSKQILFDSSGQSLKFSQLSGGEQEIAFLIGQIERFSLKRGILLIDEPELHLNYDLLRVWISYLKDTIEVGQIWFATHSLEVVEVIGKDSTFLLQRDSDRLVSDCSSLFDQPVVSTLSRAIGSPAFSIQSLKFVFIEGEEEIGERERFRLLCPGFDKIRFIEGGTSSQVRKKKGILAQIAAESSQEIRLGGVIDKDFKQNNTIKEIEDDGLHVLRVHEVENFFLHPETIQGLISQLGIEKKNAYDVIKNAAAKRAGLWVFHATRTKREFADWPAPSEKTRDLIQNMSIEDFIDENSILKIVEAEVDFDETMKQKFSRHLNVSLQILKRKLTDNTIWTDCEGKEVFKIVSKELGFASVEVAERAVFAHWMRNPICVPKELLELRQYLASL